MVHCVEVQIFSIFCLARQQHPCSAVQLACKLCTSVLHGSGSGKIPRDWDQFVFKSHRNSGNGSAFCGYLAEAR